MREPSRTPRTPRDTGQPQGGAAFWLLWSVASALLLILAPSQAWRGMPFWSLAVTGTVEPLIGALGFLVLVICLRGAGARPAGVQAAYAALALAAVYGLAAVLLSRADLTYSHAELYGSAVLGVALAVLPVVFHRPWHRAAGLSALSLALGGVLLAGLLPRVLGRPATRLVATALGPLVITVHPKLTLPAVQKRAGALEAYGASFLLVTGDGDFYRLDWDADGQTLRSRRLSLALPLDRDGYLADQRALGLARTFHLRVTDMLLDASTAPAKVFVAHQHWDRAGKCLTLRVSVADFDDDPAGAPGEHATDWQTVFDTSPCLALSPDFDELEGAGRLARYGERLLLSVGDFGLVGAGRPMLAQTTDNAYGKVLSLDRRGGQEIFSLGHRNPQGLFVDGDQQVWVAEQGPRGGDEINLVERGGNYGWPLATYGTGYDSYAWPLSNQARDHGDFSEPITAFVPGIAASSLLRVRGDRFAGWQGDLLVGTLGRRSVYRVRLRASRAIYAEPIWIGRRIRDLAEGADGRILLWTDEGDVVAMAPDPAGTPAANIPDGGASPW